VSNVTEALERIELGSGRSPAGPRGRGRSRERARLSLMSGLDTTQPLTVGSIGSIRSGAIGTVGSMEYDGRRPRIPKVLAERIDRERGQVPFERFVRGMLEAYFDAVEAADVQRERDLDVGPPVAPLVSPHVPSAAFTDRVWTLGHGLGCKCSRCTEKRERARNDAG
jgi:hypothetical protein